MKRSHQKLKLLYLAKILLSESDDDHPLSVPELIDKLAVFGVSAERKSLYDDLEQLKVFGLDICSKKTKNTGYFVGARDFELPELKLLIDSVQSSRFITHKKSEELIGKIETLTSCANAGKLARQVFVTNRVKTLNEKIYYNVDRLNDAIAADKQITFRYFDLDLDKKPVYRKDGALYTESPVALTWDDENYYLITYKEKYASYTHYRVDKMESITITEHPRVLSDEPFDLSAYAKKIFQMFGGEETAVDLLFENGLIGVVYDRFGVDVPLVKIDDDHFSCTVKIAVSPLFLSWVASFGTKAKILSPANVVEQMKDMLQKALVQYS